MWTQIWILTVITAFKIQITRTNIWYCLWVSDSSEALVKVILYVSTCALVYLKISCDKFNSSPWLLVNNVFTDLYHEYGKILLTGPVSIFKTINSSIIIMISLNVWPLQSLRSLIRTFYMTNLLAQNCQVRLTALTNSSNHTGLTFA